MEGYNTYSSYPDSGDSSPRSREIDFENPPPSWEDQPPPPPNHKVKFLVSYGGKIQPRSHDNQLAYVGGETKILAVERSVKFPSLLSKLISLISEDSSHSPNFTLSSFKYQLPGEDLDALISVTNDDDLEHMMNEYDRLYRGSAKPARLRLFAFPVQPSSSSAYGSGSSEPGKLDRDRFVEALNSVPPPVLPVVPDHPVPVPAVNNNVDFLFGLENHNNIKAPVGPAAVPVHVVKGHEPVPQQHIDPQIDARIQELNRIQISAHEQQQQQQQHHQQNIYRPNNNIKSEDNNNNFAGGFAGESAYQKPPPTIPASVPASVQIPTGYWQQPPPEQQLHHHHHQQQQPPPQQRPHHQQQQQPVYMIHTAPPPPANVYHAPVVRPVSGQQAPPPQGYYQVQRVPSDPPVYREQPVYSMAPVPAVPAPAKMGGYSEGMGVPVRQVAGLAENNTTGGGYTQVAYDSATGRHVYYAAPPPQGVVTAPFQGGAVNSSGEMRPGSGPSSGPGAAVGLTNVEGKVVTKVSPTTAAV